MISNFWVWANLPHLFQLFQNITSLTDWTVAHYVLFLHSYLYSCNEEKKNKKPEKETQRLGSPVTCWNMPDALIFSHSWCLPWHGLGPMSLICNKNILFIRDVQWIVTGSWRQWLRNCTALWMIYWHSSKTCGAGFTMDILQATPWSKLRGPWIKIWCLLISRTPFLHGFQLRSKKMGFLLHLALKSVGCWTKCLGNQVLWQCFLSAASYLHNKMFMTCHEVLGKRGRCSGWLCGPVTQIYL